jgi:hypothetical protein
LTQLYIAGPMRGHPNCNRERFAAVAAKLRARGFVVINPGELDSDYREEWHPDQKLAYMRECMLRDCAAVCGSHGVYMLAGWQASSGAQAEHALAKCLPIRIVYESIDDVKPVFPNDKEFN